MAMNPMQQQMSPDMLMAMMTDPRASPQQRMAAMSALNTMKGGANAPAPPPQMTGDSTGVSTIDPAFMAAVRQEVMGQGPEAQPEIPQRQAAPEAPQDPTTQALMSGAADASRVAAMARGGAVRGYNEGGKTLLEKLVQNAKSANQEDYSFLNDRFNNRGYAPVNGDVTTLSDIAENLSGAEERAQAAADKFYAEGRGKDSPQFFKDLNTIANFTPNPATMLYRGAKAITDPVARYFTGSTAEPAAVPPEYTRAIAPEVASMPVPNYDLRGRAGTFGTDAPARAEASAAAQAAPAAAQAPAPAVDPAVEAMNAQRQSESDAYKKRMEELLSGDQPLSSQDKYMALLKAGLGTMASASKPGATFLGSIGEGGMSGVQSLDELRKERAVNRMKQATLLQSQRSEDLASEDRARTAAREEKKLAWDMNPKNPSYKENEARAKYYADVGAAAGKTTPPAPTPLSERLTILAKIRAMPKGPERDAALEDYNAAVSPEKPMNDLAARTAVLNAGIKAGEAFDREVDEAERIGETPAKKAERAALRKQVVEDAKRSAAELLGLAVPNAAASPAPPAGGGWSATEVK